MFHVSDGLYFEPVEHDGVRVLARENAQEWSPILFEQIIDADSWASIVASVSKGGQIDNRYYVAQAFHKSEGKVEIVTAKQANFAERLAGYKLLARHPENTSIAVSADDLLVLIDAYEKQSE